MSNTTHYDAVLYHINNTFRNVYIYSLHNVMYSHKFSVMLLFSD
jgi:hypothetical protein